MVLLNVFCESFVSFYEISSKLYNVISSRIIRTSNIQIHADSPEVRIVLNNLVFIQILDRNLHK